MTERHAQYSLADPKLIKTLERTKTLVIVGCGLLGTSVAWAYRQQFPATQTRIVGIDNSSAALAEAEGLAVYDHLYSSLSALGAAEPADLTQNLASPVIGIVATPPAFIAETVYQLAPFCSLVMDVGSFKAPVIEDLAKLASEANPGSGSGAQEINNFVPCHPMAGSHRQGPGSGVGELFAQRWVFVLPGAAVEPELIALAHAFWQSLGARTQDIEARAHDDAVAYTSHLPHLLAAAYMTVDTPAVAAAGTGFMEFTRLAKANPDMWSQVLQANQSAWRPLLARYIESLQSLEALIDQGDADSLRSYLSARRDERVELESKTPRPGSGDDNG